MPKSRFDTEFEIRYAERLMHRQARFYGHIDTMMKLVSFLAGTAAFAGLVGADPVLAKSTGIVLAIAQAIQFVLRPADQRAAALGEAMPYARLSAKAHALDDTALDKELLEIRASNQVIELEWLRSVTYNDVAVERGCSPEHLMPVPLHATILRALA